MFDFCFDSIYVDIVGFLFFFKGNIYLFICIDWYICWLEVILMFDVMVEFCVLVFLFGWVLCFGVLRMIIFDRGL